MTAGTTFVGQFLDHDVTFDNASRLGVVTDPAQTPNTRVPRLDLDSVYGGGPSVSPQLYRVSDRATLRFGHGGLFEDLPRNPDRLISDPAAEGQADPIDLRGGARAPRRFIGWQTFFDFGGDQTQHVRPNKLIDTSISTPLFQCHSRPSPVGTRRRHCRSETCCGTSPGRCRPASGSPRPPGHPSSGGAISPNYASTALASTPDAAVVLHPARGQRLHQRRAAWPAWWPDRRRGNHRDAPARQVLLP